MKYVVLLTCGRVMSFSVLNCAEIFISAFGGVIISGNVVSKTEMVGV